MTHRFDGERSGTGEVCLSTEEGTGSKCYQRETHPVKVRGGDWWKTAGKDGGPV